MYKCPKCKRSSSKNEWNEETDRHYHDRAMNIDCADRGSAWFYCPNCSEKIDGNDIE